MSFKKPSSLLSPSLVATAERLLLLTRKIRLLVPPEYHEGLFVSHFTAGKLILVTNNAVKRIGIIGELECKLRSGFMLHNERVFRLEVKVVPQTSLPTEQKTKPLAKLSANIAKNFAQMADKETDSALKKALEKLAQRG